MTEMPVLIGSGKAHAEHTNSNDEQAGLVDETSSHGRNEVLEHTVGPTMTPDVASSSSLSDTERPLT